MLYLLTVHAGSHMGWTEPLLMSLSHLYMSFVTSTSSVISILPPKYKETHFWAIHKSNEKANMIQIRTHICNSIFKFSFFLICQGSINTPLSKKLKFSGNYFMVPALHGCKNHCYSPAQCLQHRSIHWITDLFIKYWHKLKKTIKKQTNQKAVRVKNQTGKTFN